MFRDYWPMTTPVSILGILLFYNRRVDTACDASANSVMPIECGYRHRCRRLALQPAVGQQKGFQSETIAITRFHNIFIN